MAAKKKAPPKTSTPAPAFVPAQFFRVSIAAQVAGVKRMTVVSAIERGELPSITLGCGLVIVRLADVKAFKVNAPQRKRGRPRKDAGSAE